MILHRSTLTKRLITLTASAGLLASMCACSSTSDTTDQTSSANTASETTTDIGNVVIFTPSDGITISQQTPLSKWEKLVPEIVSSLKDEGIDGENITVKSSSSLDKQSQSVQDYVVNHVNETTEEQSDQGKTTLVVAPVAQTSDSDRQYGDYAGHTISWDSDSSDEDEQAYAQAAERLVAALQLAQNEGMDVVLVSNTLDGYTPDVYVPMITAEQIGELQAQKLVEKLKLDTTSSDNPKYLEVLLPYSKNGDGDTDSNFTQSVFAGIWKILGPYFQEGKAVSPSGTLTSSSTDDDWKSVAFNASDAANIKKTLAERLGMDAGQSRHTRIDGVIACNDYVAGYVTDALESLGYTGSSADINPSITISGIVDSIAGKKDLKKKSVPDPIKAPQSQDTEDGSSDSEASDDALEEQNAQWPIVTGYGAYVSSLPSIVDGSQWMTALEKRKTLAEDIAQVCARLNASRKVSEMDFMTTSDMNGTQVPTVHEEPLAVSASNLKKALIEPGYVSLADAGL